MSTNIAIFTVFVWRIVEGKRKLESHFVAGFDSKDAEHRIKESDAAHLKDEAFIMTDECNNMHSNPAVRLYTTHVMNADNVSDEEYTTWLRTMTRAQYEDGQRIAANVRRIWPLE